MLSLLYKDQTNSNWIEDETIITYSGCLNDDSKCFSNREYKIMGDGKKTRLFDVRNPCKFPFKDHDGEFVKKQQCFGNQSIKN